MQAELLSNRDPDVVKQKPRLSTRSGRSKVETARTYRVPWAELLRKVFALDVLACPECSGRMQLIAFIASEPVARRILDHLGLDATGPPLARAQAPDDLLDPAPVHDVVDPVYTD